MFTAATLAFLRELAANNDRDWFAANRGRYEAEVKAPAAAFIDRMAADLARDTGLPHGGKLFRLHRDLRFSKDKTPYNAHIHISLAPVVPAGAAPAWMVGLAPGYFTLGCGVLAFDAAALARFRDHVAGPEGAAVAALNGDLAAGGVRFEPPELRRVPAPCARDHPRGDLLRRKGYAGWIDAQPEQGIGETGFTRAREGLARLRPLFDLLRRL